ncbi:3-hydroxyacyl-CoA dehydrogenase NAD-binding domain-containing protein [Shimia ponticola]|uniref:3-hydroxyacyl-CoA dehydrogenase NAD-binding domain-containing protein n=1 Tax=Shimia ponticola TaxID=2582893 RepID=UPI0011BD946E|nr:3-hydroxyacyl-CoA dehydrogenase NAD-binding domain-containing protein [Shimia ponticola]
MGDIIRYEVTEGVAVLSIDNPPVNALSAEVRLGLNSALDRAQADDSVSAIVLTAAGRTFPAGADIREFGKPPVEPHLPDVCNAIEASSKPVVAALHGMALGGGFELGLASHARIATAQSKVGLPEIGLGLLPGAGGTQRLPRLTDVSTALSVVLTGKPVPASVARERGLIDAISEGDLIADACALARDLAGKPPRPTRNRREQFSDGVGYQKAIEEARRVHADAPTMAAGRAIDCLEAAPLLPFDAGLALERDAFLELRDTPEAAALRHLFLAERLAAKPRSGLPAPTDLKRVAVLGGGLMGVGIAVACLARGKAVTIIEQNADTAAKTEARLRSVVERSVSRKKLPQSMLDGLSKHSIVTTQFGMVATAQLVIEAIAEDEALKKDVFAKLGAATSPKTILATNTSYLNVDMLAQASGRPGQVVGLHFFSPAEVMKLCEVVVGKETAPEVEATAFAFAKSIGKVPVRAGVCDGFIGNRVLTAYRTAADYLLEDGASPYDIDAAMRAYGFRLGPYQVLDLAGLDISWARRKRLATQRDPEARYVRIGDLLCEAGRFGRKAGAGYYRYNADSGKAERDREVLALIEKERVAKGITTQSYSAEIIQRRCLIAMANEGSKLLGEGIARSAGDIDVVMALGFGFPRHKGGPLKAAELSGLLSVQRDLEALAKEDAFWTPSQTLKHAAINGNRFDG